MLAFLISSFNSLNFEILGVSINHVKGLYGLTKPSRVGDG